MGQGQMVDMVKFMVGIIMWDMEKDVVKKTSKSQANLVPIRMHWKSELCPIKSTKKVTET